MGQRLKPPTPQGVIHRETNAPQAIARRLWFMTVSSPQIRDKASDAALPALLAKFTVRPAETGYFVART
jgi:hypothetical protein